MLEAKHRANATGPEKRYLIKTKKKETLVSVIISCLKNKGNEWMNSHGQVHRRRLCCATDLHIALESSSGSSRGLGS